MSEVTPTNRALCHSSSHDSQSRDKPSEGLSISSSETQQEENKGETVSTERPSSPETNCSICLGMLQNKSFTDSCFHTFCFTCLLEWSKVKAVCPLCKHPFKSIIHNVRSIEDYDQYDLRNNDQDRPESPDGRRFHYRTTLTTDRWMLRQQREQSRQLRLLQQPTTMTSRSHWRRMRQTATSDFRRRVYSHGLRVQECEQQPGRPVRRRNITPTFFRNNPACTHRLVPWLNRELNVLLHNHEDHVTFVLELILDLITRFEIGDEVFRTHLESFLGRRTDHFVHEFVHFARSPYDMCSYDSRAVYHVNPRSTDPLSVLTVDSSSDSEPEHHGNAEDPDIIILSPTEGSPINGPSTSSGGDHSYFRASQTDVTAHQPAHGDRFPPTPSSVVQRVRTFLTGVENMDTADTAHSGWESPVPGPSNLHSWSPPNPGSPTLVVSESFSVFQGHDNTHQNHVTAGPSHQISQDSDSDSDSDVMIVGFDKPFEQRSPIAVSSGEDEELIEALAKSKELQEAEKKKGKENEKKNRTPERYRRSRSRSRPQRKSRSRSRRRGTSQSRRRSQSRIRRRSHSRSRRRSRSRQRSRSRRRSWSRRRSRSRRSSRSRGSPLRTRRRSTSKTRWGARSHRRSRSRERFRRSRSNSRLRLIRETLDEKRNSKRGQGSRRSRSLDRPFSYRSRSRSVGRGSHRSKSRDRRYTRRRSQSRSRQKSSRGVNRRSRSPDRRYRSRSKSQRRGTSSRLQRGRSRSSSSSSSNSSSSSSSSIEVVGERWRQRQSWQSRENGRDHRRRRRRSSSIEIVERGRRRRGDSVEIIESVRSRHNTNSGPSTSSSRRRDRSPSSSRQTHNNQQNCKKHPSGHKKSSSGDKSTSNPGLIPVSKIKVEPEWTITLPLPKKSNKSKSKVAASSTATASQSGDSSVMQGGDDETMNTGPHIVDRPTAQTVTKSATSCEVRQSEAAQETVASTINGTVRASVSTSGNPVEPEHCVPSVTSRDKRTQQNDATSSDRCPNDTHTRGIGNPFQGSSGATQITTLDAMLGRPDHQASLLQALAMDLNQLEREMRRKLASRLKKNAEGNASKD